jgi:predicted nucleic acid-binding protein
LSLVLDASVAVKCFFPEEHTAEAQSVAVGAEDLHAPEVVLLEFDSVLCRRIRRGESSLADAEEARAKFRKIRVHLHPVLDLLDHAFAVAARTGCAPYDCVYLVLAIRLGGRMVTADARLCRSLAGTPLGRHLLWIGDVRPGEQTPLEPSP